MGWSQLYNYEYLVFFWLVLNPHPSPCCSFVRHLVGKMVIANVLITKNRPVFAACRFWGCNMRGKKHVGEAFATRSIRKLEMFEVGQLKIIIWFPSFESLCTNTNIFEASYVKSKKGIIARFSQPDHFQAQMDYVLKSTTFTVAILNTSIVVLALRNELQHGTLLTMPSQPTTSRLRFLSPREKRVGDLGPSLIRTFCPPPPWKSMVGRWIYFWARPIFRRSVSWFQGM